jgi:hypothetical protein
MRCLTDILRRSFVGVGFAAVVLLFSVAPAFGQGCIVARSNGEQGGPNSEGGYLSPGEWEFGIGYRHQFSFIHFVGPTEQTYRVQQGTQVENKINLENLSATYQITSRFSVTADLPILSASRHTNDSSIVYTSAGIGDTSFLVNGWVWNPKENTRGNVQLGFGLVAPTGKDNVQNVVQAASGGTATTTTVVDYSIQPGQGGWGIPFQWIGYKNWLSSQFYFNGSYTAMIQDINNVLRSSKPNPVTLTQYNAITDQYLMEGGVAHPINKIHGLTVSFGPRMEGVPARNLFPGDNLGFRRPGFAISAEPGVQYSRNGNVFTVTIARAFYRDRTISVPDVLTNGHGDAAFANWVWLASYTFRAGGKHAAMTHHDSSAALPAAHPAAASVTATKGSTE